MPPRWSAVPTCLRPGSPISLPFASYRAPPDADLIFCAVFGCPDGEAKTARKGVGGFRLLVKGRPAHAGLDFEAGANAILELSRQIDRIAGFTDLARGLTVSPGLTGGGTRTNVVPAQAWCEID